MSLSTLTKIAIQRESGAPKTTKRKSAAGEVATEERGYLSALVAAIPTEPLALYTFLVATIEANGDQRLFMRWAIYVVTIVVIALWVGASFLRNRDQEEKKRRFPLVETAAAVAAFAAWGLAMPESPLNAELSGDDRTIWTAIITAAGVVVLGMLGKPLTEEAKPRGKGTGKQKRQQQPAKDAPVERRQVPG
jgi:cation transport ATPase